jgi:dihydrofolate synthase/folylpolyglutamate synthase
VTWEDGLAWLYSTRESSIKFGLEKTHRLLDALGRPDKNLRFLHVAGTNGKGSVCAMLDAILRRSGYRVGLFTSPHLKDFRERIRVDGEMISESDASVGLSRIRGAVEGWENGPTFFEIATILALDYFAERGCDFVVLETGMGGRLDSTNAVTPLVSVITPIAMDHMSWLGETLPEIAGEKAGIIKDGVPVVSAPQAPEAASVLVAKALECGAPLKFVSSPWSGEIALAGHHQKWNAALAVAALQAAGVACSEECISDALAGVSWPARFQFLSDRLVLDGAHNIHSARALVETWREVFQDERATVVFGALQDKEYAGMLKVLAEIAADFVFVPVRNERSATVESFSGFDLVPSAIAENLPAGLALALSGSRPVLVTGSLYLAGEVLELAEKSPF